MQYDRATTSDEQHNGVQLSFLIPQHRRGVQHEFVEPHVERFLDDHIRMTLMTLRGGVIARRSHPYARTRLNIRAPYGIVMKLFIPAGAEPLSPTAYLELAIEFREKVYALLTQPRS